MDPKEEGAGTPAGSQIAGCTPSPRIRLSRFFRVKPPHGCALCYSWKDRKGNMDRPEPRHEKAVPINI